MTDDTARIARLMNVCDAIIEELQRHGVADVMAGRDFRVADLAVASSRPLTATSSGSRRRTSRAADAELGASRDQVTGEGLWRWIKELGGGTEGDLMVERQRLPEVTRLGYAG
jgi:hypothetical protein